MQQLVQAIILIRITSEPDLKSGQSVCIYGIVFDGWYFREERISN
jgi:hypothetical protein